MPAGSGQARLNLIAIITGSSVAVIIVVFIIAGCICGRIHKRTPSQETSINIINQSPQHSSPVYETIFPPMSWPQDEKQDIQLKSNVLYGQCELTWSAPM